MDDFAVYSLLALSDTSTYLMMGVSVLFILFVLFRPVFGRKRDPLTNSPLRFSVSQQKNLERDMQNLLVELHEMARTMTAQIETRAKKLELLIAEADEKIARLQSGASTGAPASGATPRPQSIDLPAQSESTQRPDQHAEVYQLADAGLDGRQIAARLGRPFGEIELLLALRRRNQRDLEVSEPPISAKV
jgi:hypothetical protein